MLWQGAQLDIFRCDFVIRRLLPRVKEPFVVISAGRNFRSSLRGTNFITTIIFIAAKREL